MIGAREGLLGGAHGTMPFAANILRNVRITRPLKHAQAQSALYIMNGVSCLHQKIKNCYQR